MPVRGDNCLLTGGQAFKERRFPDIGRTIVPCIQFGPGHFNHLPCFSAGKNIRITLLKHLGRYKLSYCGGYFFVCRPDVFQINRISILTQAYRFGGNIQCRRACQRVDNNQRWRCEIIGLGEWMHASFKISVSGQHRRNDQIIFQYRFFNSFIQWAGIANASSTAIAYEIKAKLFQKVK